MVVDCSWVLVGWLLSLGCIATHIIHTVIVKVVDMGGHLPHHFFFFCMFVRMGGRNLNLGVGKGIMWMEKSEKKSLLVSCGHKC